MTDLFLRYRITGQVTETSSSDENILIEETCIGKRKKITVTALRQMRLYEASISLPRTFAISISIRQSSSACMHASFQIICPCEKAT